ncbi:MAG: DNA repair protein RecN [Pseudomonadota bacterium]|nr:DNA repair protein RecN [Pseudomonadota bacterium]
MLESIRLRDFVIVDAAEVEFAEGFCVLTGETGAGKSILIDALGLALGARADAGTVRQGAARADIAASFAIDAPTAQWLAERKLEGDEGRVLLRRIIEADGRSKALVNGHPATAAILRELGARLIEIHGQHASQSLLRPEGQRALLDAHAGLGALLRETGQAWARLREARLELEAAEANSREFQLERERIAWQVDEIGRLEPVAGEWESLSEDHARLSNAAELIDVTGQASEALAGDDGAISTRLHRILGRLRGLLDADPRLANVVEMLDSAAIQVDEAASELASYASRIDLDPQRLEQIDGRLAALHSTARKLRLEPEGLATELERLQAELARLDRAQDHDALRARVASAQADYDSLATALSGKRRAAVRRLELAVTEAIRSFGMAGARLRIGIEAGEPGPGGIDRVEFLIAGHAGVEPRPIGRVASGGELSRVALGITVSAAEANPVPTLIFDEADAGVGGAVAEAIGDRMRSLGESRQVLCVTHLPQVAARAHHQYRVAKSTRGSTTTSRIGKVEGNERIDEIARMLGGAKLTDTGREHAREMLAGRPPGTDSGT